MKKNFLIIAIVAIIVASGGSFYGGMRYQQAHLKKGFNGQMPPGGIDARGGNGNNKNGGNFISGSIISKDDESMTIKTQDGSTKVIYLSDSTTIAKSDKGTPSDLAVGQNISADGTSNSDGSIAAKNVQIRPSQ
ncbi:MAG: hypothetical protein WCV58_00095 [Patescibacteria group bacterium]